jgi:hypothetical protein
VLAGAILVALGIVIVRGFWWHDDTARVPSWPVSTAAAPVAGLVPASQLSIVVLPFANLSGDSRQDYFADGITESLTTDLSRALPGSFVIARGTAFSYRWPGDESERGRSRSQCPLCPSGKRPPGSRETMITARGLFQQALDFDPDNVCALAGVATTYVLKF